MEQEKPKASVIDAKSNAVVLTDEERSARMRVGVDSLFVLWAALDVMKEAMPGRETEEIIEDMFEGILEQFTFGKKPKANVSQTDLEDMIYDFTSRDLHTELEDGSVEQVADYTFQLFRGVCANDVTVFEKLVSAASRRRKAPPKRSVVIEEMKENENEGEDEEEEEEEEEGESGSEEGSGEQKEENKPKEDDEWTVVGKKPQNKPQGNNNNNKNNQGKSKSKK
jgi:hypothetical protein